MELIFEADWETMQRTNRLTMFLQVRIKLLRPQQSNIKENLKQVVILPSVSDTLRLATHVIIYQLVSKRPPLTERVSDLCSRERPVTKVLEKVHNIKSGDAKGFLVEKRFDEFSRQLLLLLPSLQGRLGKEPFFGNFLIIVCSLSSCFLLPTETCSNIAHGVVGF
jgi:hypothetical protein